MNYQQKEDLFSIVRTKSNPIGGKPTKKKAVKPSLAKEAVKQATAKLSIDPFIDLVRLRNPQPASALIVNLLCMTMWVFRQIGKTPPMSWD